MAPPHRVGYRAAVSADPSETAKSDTEIVKAMICQYGAEAAYRAARRADEYRAEGKTVAAATWDKVVAAINAPTKSRK